MGSPQYGTLILDGQAVLEPSGVEAHSLVWSNDCRCLAAQELIEWSDGPVTRVVVIDTERRTPVAASAPRKGIANPVRFEPESLVYRHWHHRDGEEELRLGLSDYGARH